MSKHGAATVQTYWRLAVLVGVVLVAAPAIGCEKSPEVDGMPQPITIERLGASVQKDLNTLIAEADLIVVGKAMELGPARWNTPSGRLPQGLTPRDLPPSLVIFRDTGFRVSSALKGTTPEPVVLLRTFGGTVENVTLLVEGEDDLQPGQEYLLFLAEDRGSTATMGPGHYLIGAPMPQVYRISNGKAISEQDEWVLGDLIRYIETTLAAGDSAGIGDYLRQRYQDMGVPILSVTAVGPYVEVVYQSDRNQPTDTPEDRLYRHLILREIELARQEGFSLVSWRIAAAEVEGGSTFAIAYGQTKPDAELWLDTYPSAFTDEETANMIRGGLNLGDLTVASLTVSSSEGLQTVMMELGAPSKEIASEEIIGFVGSLHPLLDTINAQGAHVVSLRITLVDGTGKLLVSYIRDLRVNMESRWTSEGIPTDWRTPVPTPTP